MSTDVSAAVRDLSTQIEAARLLVSGQGFEEARAIWNGAVEGRPALIVRARTRAEVQAAVRVAHDHRLPLSVRGGGHDWAGRALRPDAMVVDLTGMRQVTVDTASRVAAVAGGATLRDVIIAGAPHRLVTPTGTVGAVGMTGLTLGGGYGPLNGRFGLALDNLLGAEVVIADGRLVATDVEHEPELFWAIRGGGGNFGVVTSMRVRMHRLDQVLAGFIVFPWSQAADVWSGLRGLLSNAPDDLTVQSGVLNGPDGPTMFLSPTWSGDLVRGNKVIEELTGLGSALDSQTGPMSYLDLLGAFDPYVVNGRHYAASTRSVLDFTPEVTTALIDAGQTSTSAHTMISIHHFHGAAARVRPDSTAFGLRTTHFMVEFVAAWEPGQASDRAWAASASAAMAPYALPGGYPNMLGPDDHDQVKHAYGSNAPRLLAAKAHYDPDGIFSATSLPLPD